MTCFSFLFRKKRAPLVRRTCEIEEVVSGIHNIMVYSYKDLKIATGNFSSENKIGMGGFGSVYKGRLKDGTAVAIKVLSAESRQGVCEFLTEINVIASIEHHNLVKLYGCCVEEDQRILVYGYLENNSLEQTLLGRNCNNLQFNWQTRRKICIGVAEGLAFLHEEVHPHVIHRDIKASNILLDKDLSPKISDFGLAKLIPANLTHVSTQVAGTVGYLAPEYAIRGQVTRKADIYSFGVLLIEIVSGRCNTNKRLPPNKRYLLERVWVLFEQGELMALVDTALSEDVDIKEACRFLKIGLVCTQDIPKLRPPMSTVVEMLNGQIDVDDKILSKPGLLSGIMDVRDDKDGKERVSSKDASYVTSADSGNHSQSSSSNMFNSYATMTFTSIYDRSK